MMLPIPLYWWQSETFPVELIFPFFLLNQFPVILFYKQSHRNRGQLWKAPLRVSGPTPCTEQVSQSVVSACSLMALPCKQGNLADTNPLGLISLHFPQKQCYAETYVSTSSPGCREKLSQGTASPVPGLGTGD